MMRKPHALGVGPVSVGLEAAKSLGGDRRLLPHTGSHAQLRISLAARLDREADQLLFVGRHAVAERLAHQAESLRQGVLS